MSRLNRVRRSIEKNNDFAEARRILNEQELPFFTDGRLVLHKSQVDEKEDKTNIINDRGNGRASRGMRFLELMAVSFKGKELDSLLMFDKIDFPVNPQAFHRTTISDREKVNLIAKSLGVEDFINIERMNNTTFSNNISERFIAVFNDVIDGTFLVRANRPLLSFCRGLVRRAINTRNANG